MHIQIVRSASGRGFRLEASQHLPYPRDQVFDFFSDASNLQLLTPAWLHMSVVTSSPIPMHVGALIDYQLYVHGIPLRWQSHISVWDPPLRFVDEQTCGPYRRWHHEHVFESADSGTLCRDIVNYEVWGGSWVNFLFVRRDLFKIFAFRQHKLCERFPPLEATLSRHVVQMNRDSWRRMRPC